MAPSCGLEAAPLGVGGAAGREESTLPLRARGVEDWGFGGSAALDLCPVCHTMLRYDVKCHEMIYCIALYTQIYYTILYNSS